MNGLLQASEQKQSSDSFFIIFSSGKQILGRSMEN